MLMNSKFAYPLGVLISLIYIPIRCIISLIKSIVALCRNDESYQHNSLYLVFFLAACMVGVFAYHFQSPMLMVIWPLMTLLLSLCCTLPIKRIDDYTNPLEILILLKDPWSKTQVDNTLSDSLTGGPITANSLSSTLSKASQTPNIQPPSSSKELNLCSTLVSLVT